MSPAIPTLARRPRHHRRRRPVSPPPPRGSVRRIALRFEWLEDRTVLSTFTVTSLADAGPGSLRQAILDANAQTTGTSTIAFDIPGAGVQAIAPASPLPAITRAVLIDGTSQPSFDGTPLIELDGSQAGTADGLTITGPDVTVRGLVINGFDSDQSAGIHITGTAATRAWIYGNFVGTDPTGTLALPNFQGIVIDAGASENRVGTDGDGLRDGDERNVISGNSWGGVTITGHDAGYNLVGAEGNIVAGNLIGTDLTGRSALGNGAYGVSLDEGASSNRIGIDANAGQAAAQEENIISGNGWAWWWINGSRHVSPAVVINGSRNVVAGNKIGTDITGEAPLPNQGDGVQISADDNTIGGIAAGAGNLIAYNGEVGVSEQDTGNAILGNRIFANGVQATRVSNDAGQSPPLIFRTVGGRIEGWISRRAPGTTFRLEFFADVATDGTGQAEQFLGSLPVTTDATGQAVFAVPQPPADKPGITATATDPQGHTSGLSTARRASLQVPAPIARLLPGGSRVWGRSSGGAFAISEVDVGWLDADWEITLSAEAGALTLSPTSGLVGSGDGTGTLEYHGSLAAVNAALDGLTYTPPAGYRGTTTLTLTARSYGAVPLQGTVTIIVTDGIYLVTTTADSGPGSLRQAILDSNVTGGGTNTIAFAIPGAGVHTIAPRSPLPAITTAVLIDGTTQPGDTGAATIALDASSSGDPDGLAISDAEVTVRGVAFAGLALGASRRSAALVVQSDALRPGPGGDVALERVDTTADGLLVAQVHALGPTTRLSLLDAHYRELVQSEGRSPDDGDDRIDQHLPAGTYFLRVERLAGVGTYTMTATLTPASQPFDPLPAGWQPVSLVTGDFDGDGRLDLAAADKTFPGDVRVLLGDGDGSFRPAAPYAVGDVPFSLVAGDFDGDGRLDLATASYEDHTISMLMGNGDGTFRPQVVSGVGRRLVGLAVGDFDGDGRIDLAGVDPGDLDEGGTDPGGVTVLFGRGDGSFQVGRRFAAGAGPIALVARDLDGDGRVDLAILSQYSNDITVLLGDGDGTFRPPAHFAVGLEQNSPAGGEHQNTLVAGDFDGDGRLDLAVGGRYSTEVSVLMGNGDGTFRPRIVYAVTNSTSLVTGDFNGDGNLDLATSSSSGTVSVLLGHGDGSFQTGASSPVEDLPTSLAAGDFDGDGRLDLATTNPFNSAIGATITVLLGNGDSTFRTRPINAVGANPRSPVTGDFNGDGRLDLATANPSSHDVFVLLGDGDGTFRPQESFATGSDPWYLVTGDFNGDGRLDLAAATSNALTSSADVMVLLGDGDGSFRPSAAYAVGSYAGDLVAGDLNGDGRLDLIVLVVDPFDEPSDHIPRGVRVLLGDGDGTFQPLVFHASASDPIGVVTGDFNGDGRLDLATTDTAGDVLVWLGDGDGSFEPPAPYAVGRDPTHVVAGDFDGDGHLDLATNNFNDDTISVLLGDGDGTFRPQVVSAVGPEPLSLVAGDFDGDGRLDLAFPDSSSNRSISVMLGDGDGTFRPPTLYAVGSHPMSLVASDFDGDGRLDLATANAGSADITVLMGGGDGTFVDPGQLATTPRATPLIADVNGDGTEDALVVDGAGDILSRQGIPGRPGTFQPPVTVNHGFPSRDIAWVPKSDRGPLLASLDARDNAVELYAWSDGGFIRLESLATGRLPAQVVATDLDDDGLSDLVVRDAADGLLSVYFGDAFDRGRYVGPLTPQFAPPSFRPAVDLFVGAGISDVAAADTTGTGRLDLLIANKLTGQVSLVRNLGARMLAPSGPYRAGAGLYGLETGSGVPTVTSLEATAGIAAGPPAPGAPISLVAINPGSNTIGVLAGLGQGRFADPVPIQSRRPASVVRVGDFNRDGGSDLAVLSAQGVDIYLATGRGGFAPPVTYDAGPDPTGLTVADLDRDGHPDLLIGNPYGDVLVLLGRGDGTFHHYRPADLAVALAVADLTGDGRPDFVYAYQGLDRVTVQYGGDQTRVLGDHSDGILSPGAVKLADLTGDGLPDLIVANSGSNNILVYPGTGDGEFGPAANGGHGFFVGTGPAGQTVADLNGDGHPDLLVANSGSNDVSVLLGQGSGSSWTMAPGPRIKTDAGPVAVAVGDILNDSHPDLAVANQQADDVQVFPGAGGGFFNDQPQAVRTYAVGQAPSGLFLGRFGASGTGIATINAGSNSVTLIGPTGVEQTVPAGGLRPTTGFAGDFTGDGFTDLVVGNSADGHLALLTGGTGGLSLSQTISSAATPEPTGLSFAGVSDGLLSFYVSTAGREAATALAFNLSGPGVLPGLELASGPVQSAGAVLASATAGAFQQVAQLLSANGSTLSLVAPLFTVTVLPGEFEAGASSEGGVVLLANFLPGTGPGAAGQGLRGDDDGPPAEATDEPGPAEERAAETVAAPPTLPPWEQVAMGLKRAWEQVRSEVLERAGLAEGDGARPVAAPDRRSKPAPAAVRPPDRPHPRPPAPERAGPDAPDGPSAAASPPGEATDTALAELGGPTVAAPRAGPGWWDAVIAAGRGRLAPPIATAAAMASAGAAAWAIQASRKGRGGARGPSRPLVSPN